MARGLQKRNRIQAQKPQVASYGVKPSTKPKPKLLQKSLPEEKFVVQKASSKGQWTEELIQTTI